MRLKASKDAFANSPLNIAKSKSPAGKPGLVGACPHFHTFCDRFRSNPTEKNAFPSERKTSAPTKPSRPDEGARALSLLRPPSPNSPPLAQMVLVAANEDRAAAAAGQLALLAAAEVHAGAEQLVLLATLTTAGRRMHAGHLLLASASKSPRPYLIASCFDYTAVRSSYTPTVQRRSLSSPSPPEVSAAVHLAKAEHPPSPIRRVTGTSARCRRRCKGAHSRILRR